MKSGFALERLCDETLALTGEAVSPKMLLVVTSQLAVMLAAGCDLLREGSMPFRGNERKIRPSRKYWPTCAQPGEAGAIVFLVVGAASGGIFRPVRDDGAGGRVGGVATAHARGALQTMIRNNMRIVSSIRNALMYPVILTIVAMGAITVMTTFVLPRFAKVFRDSHVPMPPVTMFVISSSEVVAANFAWIILGVLTAVAGFIWLLNHPAVRNLRCTKWVLKVPLLGQTLILAYVCRSIQTMGMLIKSGLPLAEALVLTRDMMPNIYYWRFL